MEENIITWNVANWITVVLMALVFFFLLGLFQHWYSNRQSSEG